MKEKLKKLNYTIFKPSVNHNYCTSAFQKRIIDSMGIKFFVNCYIYNHFDSKEKVEFEAMVYTKYGVLRLQTLQWAFNTENDTEVKISDVEKIFEDTWINLGSNYYEKFE